MPPSVAVRDMTGNLEVEAGMGSISVVNADIRDRLDLDAGMGAIAFYGVPGADNQLNAGMGSIEFVIPPDSILDLRVDVAMGSFRSDLSLDGSRSGHSFRGRLGKGEPTGTAAFEAGMGSVRIRPLID